MGAFRDWLQDRPAVGYGVVGLIVVIAIGIAMTRLARPTEVEELGQFITLKDSETGERWKVPLGAIERNLHGRELPIDPKEGMPNPTTGKRTGFPEKDWEKIVQRVMAERQQEMAERQKTLTPKP
ncbi:MAG: hypothetical protein K2W85_03420 [Phycisphaerales bacterium]|nr:hypothetical protein [Phycisphaerales bacterium]